MDTIIEKPVVWVPENCTYHTLMGIVVEALLREKLPGIHILSSVWRELLERERLDFCAVQEASEMFFRFEYSTDCSYCRATDNQSTVVRRCARCSWFLCESHSYRQEPYSEGLPLYQYFCYVCARGPIPESIC